MISAWYPVVRTKTSRVKKEKAKEKGRGEEERHTKLPANPPAIKATPINKITLALQAAGPSDP